MFTEHSPDVPSSLCVWKLSRQRGWARQYATARSRVALARPARPSAAGRSARKSSASNRSGVASGLRIDELELVAARQHERRAGLRAHADPVESRRRLLGSVGLDRDLESRACSASTAASSSCSSGSPPVQTTNGRAAARASTASARRRPRASVVGAVANLPPSGPTPTKSVSQNWQTARRAICLASRPQIAAGEAAEHRRRVRRSRPRPAACRRSP